MEGIPRESTVLVLVFGVRAYRKRESRVRSRARVRGVWETVKTFEQYLNLHKHRVRDRVCRLLFRHYRELTGQDPNAASTDRQAPQVELNLFQLTGVRELQ